MIKLFSFSLSASDPRIYRFRQSNEFDNKVTKAAPFITSPWRPVNPRVLTPFCEKSGRAPGIFWPPRVGFGKDGMRKFSKRYREKTKEKKRLKRAEKEKKMKAGVVEDSGGIRVVDMSRAMRTN